MLISFANCVFVALNVFCILYFDKGSRRWSARLVHVRYDAGSDVVPNGKEATSGWDALSAPSSSDSWGEAPAVFSRAAI